MVTRIIHTMNVILAQNILQYARTPAGGMYKALNEIDMSRIKSDAGLFLVVKNIYQNGTGFKSRWRMFLKPVSVEFVQV